MPQVALYLLIRGDAYCFGELLSMLRRQKGDVKMPRIIGVISPVTGKETTDHARSTLDDVHLLSHVDGAAEILNTLVSNQPEEVAVFFDSDFIPANTVWLDRLLEPIRKEESQIVIGRIVHDLYTNWLIVNDYAAGQNLNHRNDISSFYFQHGNFAVTKTLLAKKPLLEGNLTLTLMRWAITNPAPFRFVADAPLSHLSAITPQLFAQLWGSYGRERFSVMGRFFMALQTLVAGLLRDLVFSFSKRAPLWVFYSFYLRSRQFLRILAG